MKSKKIILNLLVVMLFFGSVQANDTSYGESIKKFSKAVWSACCEFCKAHPDACGIAGSVVGSVGVIVGMWYAVDCIIEHNKRVNRKNYLKFTQNLIKLQQADPNDAEEISEIMANLIESNSNCRYAITIPTLLVTNKVCSSQPLVVN